MNERNDPLRDETPPPAPTTDEPRDEPRDEPPVWDTGDTHDEEADEAEHRHSPEGAPDEPPW